MRLSGEGKGTSCIKSLIQISSAEDNIQTQKEKVAKSHDKHVYLFDFKVKILKL